MNRSLLAAAALLAVSGAACSDATFSRTCYDVADEVEEVRGDTIVLTTGLRYLEIAAGAGTEAAECTNVTVDYLGQLLDGSEFDQGTFVFVPGAAQVISGFEQGVVGMRVGGTRRVIVPPELGYGSREIVDPATQEVIIPANSTLVFDIEVLEVVQ